jgi:hypothetical protein
MTLQEAICLSKYHCAIRSYHQYRGRERLIRFQSNGDAFIIELDGFIVRKADDRDTKGYDDWEPEGGLYLHDNADNWTKERYKYHTLRITTRYTF